MSSPRFWPHLVRTDATPDDLAPVVATAAEQGMRVGWLELASRPAQPVPAQPVPAQPVPDSLERAATAGVLRAVSVGGGRTVTVKPMRGEPVLRDVLREHFRGCALVLVSQPGPEPAVDAPRLVVLDDGRYRITGADQEVCVDTVDLVARLRRPRPW